MCPIALDVPGTVSWPYKALGSSKLCMLSKRYNARESNQ